MNLQKETIDNNLENNNELLKENEQTKFIETNLGKTINFGLDIGLRAVLPDFIEEQVIDVKDTILENGFSDGIKKVVTSAVELGKSAAGIVTGKFDNISQVQNAIKNGGIIIKSGKLSYNLANTIRKGKNVILNSITNKIEENFTNQLESLEKLEKYSNNWKNYFNEKNFLGMQKEFEKIKEKLKELIPTENTLKQARAIENLHTLIKNNGQNFNFSEEQLKLAEMLI